MALLLPISLPAVSRAGVARDSRPVPLLQAGRSSTTEPYGFDSHSYRGRYLLLAVIVLAHVALIYALQNAAPSVRTSPAVNELVVSLIAPDQPHQPLPVSRIHTPPPVPKKIPDVKPIVNSPAAVIPSPASEAITVAPATPPPVTAPPEQPVAVSPPLEQPAAAVPAVAAPIPAPAPVPVPVTATPSIVSGVEYISKPPLVYPVMSRRLNEEGTVMLVVLVNHLGLPERVQIQKSSGFPRLDIAAQQAALRYVFKPYIENGRAVAASALIPITFELNN
jgi:protein TonB